MPYPAIQPTVPTTAPLTSEMTNMVLDTNAAMTIRDNPLAASIVVFWDPANSPRNKAE